MKVHTFIFIAIIIMAAVADQAFADWTTPVPVQGINTSAAESGWCLSDDGLTMYFDRTTDHWRLFQATRPTVNSAFSSATAISELNSSSYNTSYPSVSLDGLKMYYTYDSKLRVTTRSSTTSTWSAGQYLTELNTVGRVEDSRLSADECTIVFQSAPVGGQYDMYIASRSDTSSPFSNIRNLSELNTSFNDGGASLSADGLTIYFGSDRSGQRNVYTATRSSISDLFSLPQVIPTFAGFGAPRISMDGQTMLLWNNWDVYVSTIPEPATMALLTLGGLMLRRRMR